ncbi:MAG TPA: energy transducer TonB, partial [Candidatus Eisenbacteria bacterium]|nr:energy transducer TonB [Candidatus Eisenbacteria bacterium]
EEEAPPVYYGYDTPPRALRTFEPAYPTAAKASGFEGTVVININLDERGSILRAWVASANAPELLISTALDAVYQFRFAPGLARGVPVRCTVAVPFRFFLKRTT